VHFHLRQAARCLPWPRNQAHEISAPWQLSPNPGLCEQRDKFLKFHPTDAPNITRTCGRLPTSSFQCSWPRSPDAFLDTVQAHGGQLISILETSSFFTLWVNIGDYQIWHNEPPWFQSGLFQTYSEYDQALHAGMLPTRSLIVQYFDLDNSICDAAR